jgi:ATP-dependent DNA helicase RecG
MMNLDTINMLVQEGEGLTVEFKERFTPRIDEDIVAFSNTKGGSIFLGVKDDRTISGEKLTNDLKARINSIARNCSPPIQVKLKQLGDVVSVEVPQGEEKPYSCKSGYFRRLDGTTQKMTNHELRIMFQDGEIFPFEEIINKSITWGDISKQKIRDFLKEADISLKRISPEHFLSSLNVAREGHITNAGVLFFAENVCRFVLQAQMTLIAFKGREKVHIYDRQDIRDDLLTQFNAAVFFFKKHLNRGSVIRGVNREDVYEIPLEVIREAVVNAIVHRDYGIRGTSLMVEIYDDRVEITNPGGLPRGLHEKDFGRISVRRNEIIADLFYRMDKVERAGTGIQRMKDSMAAAGLPLPEIKYDTFFTITLRRPPKEEMPGSVKSSVKGSVKSSVKILEAIRANKNVSAKEISQTLGISLRGVEKQLSNLKESGRLRRIGPAKGGYWEIVEDK